MPEKYIDLKEELAHSVVVGAGITAIRNILEWLDAHPDQVPGRTITESQIAEAFGDEYHYWAKGRLSRIGITVVPDPEPTNAEKWEAFILREIRGNPQWDARTVAIAIDEAGAAAPGGE